MANRSLNILSFINRYSRLKEKANRIKEDEEKRMTSCYFGITSLITSIFAAVFCSAGGWLFVGFMDSGLAIFTIIIGIGLILCGVVLYIWALIRMLLQFGINKKWSGWCALIFLIASIVASAIIVVSMLG